MVLSRVRFIRVRLVLVNLDPTNDTYILITPWVRNFDFLFSPKNVQIIHFLEIFQNLRFKGQKFVPRRRFAKFRRVCHGPVMVAGEPGSVPAAAHSDLCLQMPSLDGSKTHYFVCGVDSFIPELEHLIENPSHRLFSTKKPLQSDSWIQIHEMMLRSTFSAEENLLDEIIWIT